MADPLDAPDEPDDPASLDGLEPPFDSDEPDDDPSLDEPLDESAPPAAAFAAAFVAVVAPRSFLAQPEPLNTIVGAAIALRSAWAWQLGHCVGPWS